jgi:hypothetical protein
VVTIVKKFWLVIAAGGLIALSAAHASGLDLSGFMGYVFLPATYASGVGATAPSMVAKIGVTVAQASVAEAASMIVLATGFFCAASFMRRRRKP